jgi:hypothetical protein
VCVWSGNEASERAYVHNLDFRLRAGKWFSSFSFLTIDPFLPHSIPWVYSTRILWKEELSQLGPLEHIHCIAAQLSATSPMQSIQLVSIDTLFIPIITWFVRKKKACLSKHGTPYPDNHKGTASQEVDQAPLLITVPSYVYSYPQNSGDYDPCCGNATRDNVRFGSIRLSRSS